MGTDLLIGIIGAVVGGLVTLICFIWQLPKIRAEARKLNVEADNVQFDTLSKEIAWMKGKINAQARQIATLEKEAQSSLSTKRENVRLRARVKKLEERCGRLEAIFRIGPVSPEMQAALDKLDEISGRTDGGEPE